MDNEQLKTFILVKEMLNLSKVAEALHVTQPTVSKRINNLERELGSKLIHKVGRNIVPTREGEVFYRYAQKILSYMEEAKESVQLARNPSLIVGFAPFSSEFVMRGVNHFNLNHDSTLTIIEGLGSKELTLKVVNREIDLAIVRTLYTHPGLISKHICNDSLKFVLSKDHPLAKKDKIKKEDLIGQTLISFVRDIPIWQQIDDQIVGADNVKRLEVRTLEKLKSMVIANWGVSFIPYLAIEPYEKELLCIKPYDFLEGFNEVSDDSNKVIAVFRSDSPNIEVIQQFIKSIKHELGGTI